MLGLLLNHSALLPFQRPQPMPGGEKESQPGSPTPHTRSDGNVTFPGNCWKGKQEHAQPQGFLTNWHGSPQGAAFLTLRASGPPARPAEGGLETLWVP